MLAILFYAVKVIPSFIWIQRFGTRSSIAGGFLLSVRLGLVIAASSVGLELGAITSGANASFIIMVAITCFASPFLYGQINRKKSFSEDQTIIVGGSSVGVLLARRLKLLNKSPLIIEVNPERYSEIKSNNLEIILADGLKKATYEQINLKSNCYVVVLTGSAQIDLEICELLRREFYHERIISVPGNSRIEHQMLGLGVEIMDARRVLASTIENLILSPSTYRPLIETFENYSVEDITVLNDKVAGKRIIDIPLPKDSMIVLVTHGNEKYVPHGETYFRAGDVITVFGTGSAIEEIRNIILRS